MSATHVETLLPAAAAGNALAVAPHAVEIVASVGPEWDSIVAEFSDVTVEQTASHMGERWGAGRLCGLLVRSGTTGEVEAAALVILILLPLIRVGLAYVKFGPLWRRRGQAARPALLGAALDALRAEFSGSRHLQLRIIPPADPVFADEWTARLAAADIRKHADSNDPERYLVDLTLSEAEQLASLGTKWRANLRKVGKDLSIREVDIRRNLPAFLSLYGNMSARKKFADYHHIENLPAYVEACPSSLGLRMFMAYQGAEPVAGSIIIGSGERVFVPFSASAGDALPLRAGYAVRWHIIDRLRGTDARWLDLGGTEGDDGLRHFKAGNVGSRGRIVSMPGEFRHASGPLAHVGGARDRLAAGPRALRPDRPGAQPRLSGPTIPHRPHLRGCRPCSAANPVPRCDDGREIPAIISTNRSVGTAAPKPPPY